MVVIADRCADDTARVARTGGAQCLERNEGPGGKGAAMSWAMQVLRKEGVVFDALVIVDADCLADSRLCLLYTSPSPRDRTRSRMPSSA